VYQPIQFIAVNGIYKHSVNEDEANTIIEIIKNRIHPNQNGEYPTLGIATFNLAQRNLIKDLIHATSIRNIEFRQKMEAIGAPENWFVKNLENIQGDERDIIMISTTFGINGHGKFRQNFGPLNNIQNGYKLLNVIITRAKKQLYILTSIPDQYYNGQYESELLERGNKGKGIFYAYLDYCRSVAQKDENKRQAILKLVASTSDEADYLHNDFQTSKYAIEREVYQHLLEYIDSKHIELYYPMGGYQIDIVIKNHQNQPKIAIECDGKDWHSTDEAYNYDIHRQKIIENFGLHYIRIWAKDWWMAADKETVSLVLDIKELMSEVVKK
jgi:very-short-patch-repair endonuclease